MRGIWVSAILTVGFLCNPWSEGPQLSIVRRICLSTLDDLEPGRVYGCYRLDKDNRPIRRPAPVVFMERVPVLDMGRAGRFRENDIHVCPIMSPGRMNGAFEHSSVTRRKQATVSYVPVASPNSEVESPRYNNDPPFDPIRIEPPLSIDVAYITSVKRDVRLPVVHPSTDFNKKEASRSPRVIKRDFIRLRRLAKYALFMSIDEDYIRSLPDPQQREHSQQHEHCEHHLWGSEFGGDDHLQAELDHHLGGSAFGGADHVQDEPEDHLGGSEYDGAEAGRVSAQDLGLDWFFYSVGLSEDLDDLDWSWDGTVPWPPICSDEELKRIHQGQEKQLIDPSFKT